MTPTTRLLRISVPGLAATRTPTSKACACAIDSLSVVTSECVSLIEMDILPSMFSEEFVLPYSSSIIAGKMGSEI